MKRKKIGVLLLVLSVFALSQVRGNANVVVNSASNYVVNEDFKYTEGEELIIGPTSNHNVYSVTSLTGYGVSIQQENGTDGVLHIHADAGALASKAAAVGIRDNGGASTMFNKENENLVIKTRFKFDQTFSKAIRLYFSANEVNTVAKTYKLLDMKGNKIYYNLGSGADVEVNSVNSDVTKNVWHDVAFVIENNGDLKEDKSSQDKIYAYIDGNLVYKTDFNKEDDFKGKLTEINFVLNRGNYSAESNWDIDYISTAVYNKAVAKVETNKEVTSGDIFDLNPTVTGTNSDFDPSIDTYKVIIDNTEALSYDEKTKQFTALSVEEDTNVNVKYDFVDPNVTDVTSIVKVKKAESAILPSAIEFDHESYRLAIGQKLNLKNVVKILPESASNKNVTYDIKGDLVSIENSVLVAKKNGEEVVTVNTEEGKISKNLTIIVGGNNLDIPTIGTNLSANELDDVSGYGIQGNAARPISPISVVEDEKFGSAFKIEGIGTNGASALIKYIAATKLEANKDYKLAGYVKGNNLSGIKLDIKVYGYWFDKERNDYSFATENCYTTALSFTATNNNEWYYFETNPINIDIDRIGHSLEGFKIQLWSWNNQVGKDVYYTNLALIQQDSVINHGFMLVNDGKQINNDDIINAKLNSDFELQKVFIPSSSSCDLTISSKDDTIATVTDGTIKVLGKNGTSEIQVSNGVDTVKFTIKAGTPLASITALQNNISMSIVDQKEIQITFSPNEHTDTLEVIVEKKDVCSATLQDNILNIHPQALGTSKVTILSKETPNVKLELNVTIIDVEVQNVTILSDLQPVEKIHVLLEESITLSSKVTPITRVDTTVVFKSLNEDIFTIDEFGKLKAIKVGNGRLKVTCGNYTSEIEVVVSEKIQSIDFENANINLNKNDTYILKPIINPENAQGNILYTSENTNIAEVDENGKITAKNEGTTTIKAVLGNVEKTITVTVENKVLSIAVDEAKIELNVGDSHKVNVTLNPLDLSHKLTYTTSDNSIATVSNDGTIKAIKEGNVTITISADGIEKQVEITVTNSNKKGCKSSIGSTLLVLLLALLGIAVVNKNQGMKNEK